MIFFFPVVCRNFYFVFSYDNTAAEFKAAGGGLKTKAFPLLRYISESKALCPIYVNYD